MNPAVASNLRLASQPRPLARTRPRGRRSDQHRRWRCTTSTALSTTQLDDQQLRKYLERVRFTRGGGAPLPPTLETLALLHWRHEEALPFENLSLCPGLAAGKSFPSTSDLASAYAKCVEGGRGGYCFESNLLLAAALRALGFDVYCGAARVVAGQMGLGAQPLPGQVALRPLCHRMTFVRLDGRLWLADVAFGSASPPLPVRLPADAFLYGAPSADEPHAGAAYAGLPWAAALPVARAAGFRVRPGLLGEAGPASARDVAQQPHRAGYYLQQKSVRLGDWKDLYFFTMHEHTDEDFAAFNAYCTDGGGSFWRRVTWVSLPSDEGRKTLVDDEFRVFDRHGDLVSEESVADDERALALLREHFGLVL